MEPLTFALIYAAGCILSMMAGYTLGNMKANSENEKSRRWWMNRQLRRERGEETK